MVMSLVLRAQKRLVDVYWKFKKRGFERYCSLLQMSTQARYKCRKEGYFVARYVRSEGFRLPKGDPAAERGAGGRLVFE